MSNQITKHRFTSWAVPTPEDDAVWNAMTREQKLQALQDLAHHPDTTTTTDITVAEIVARSRASRRSEAADDQKL